MGAEVERLRRQVSLRGEVARAAQRRATDAEARLDALVADLRGLADEWVRDAGGNVSAEADEVRAVLDKHAGEQR